ncbi:MAG: YqaA family protein [Candidatus Kapaibacterium sp.]
MKKLIEWMRKLKEWMESFAEKPGAMVTLFFLALAESSFFPIPPDVLLIAIGVSKPKRAFMAALWCTLGSVIGGILGYYIGYSLMSTVGYPIVEFYNAQEVWAKVVETYQGEVGMMFLAGAAFSPIPYKISTIAAGATGMDLFYFIVISSLGRAGRFFLVGGLIYFFGPTIKDYIDKYFDKLSIAFLVLLIGGFVLVKYIV